MQTSILNKRWCIIVAAFLLVASFTKAQESSTEAYKNFKALFQNMQFGEDDNNTSDTLLNGHPYIDSFLNENTVEEDGSEYRMIYPVGKIESYRGFDLFVIRDQSGQEGEYYNQVDYILIFQNEEQIIPSYTYNSRIAYDYFDSGLGDLMPENWRSFYFDTDTTLILNTTGPACWFKGYDIPISEKSSERYTVDNTGHLKLAEIMELRFSSPFFNPEQMNEQEADSYFDYSALEGEELFITHIFDTPIRLWTSVYWSKSSAWCSQLISKNENDEIIDFITFCLPDGEPTIQPKRTAQIKNSNKGNVSGSVIIEAEKQIELMPDGRFVVVKD